MVSRREVFLFKLSMNFFCRSFLFGSKEKEKYLEGKIILKNVTLKKSIAFQRNNFL
jgi:hypothetical protein